MLLLFSKSRSVLVTLLFFITAGFLYAGTTGKISGVVTDEATGEPLIGANVMIKGTELGGSTDLDGAYYIINVPPGKYSVIFDYLGYRSIIKQDVRVYVDRTVIINTEMSEALIETEAMVVTAERNKIQKDLTSSEVSVTSDDIKVLPVRELNDVVSLQAGVSQDAGGALHIRGGRSTEISYMVDGVQIQDPSNRTNGIRVDDQSIEELKTITGTFNAEYGQALSGVINIVTKSGSEKFTANLTGYVGDYITTDDVYSYMDNAEWARAAAYSYIYGQPFVYYDYSKYGNDFASILRNKPYLTKSSTLSETNPFNNSDVQLNLSGPIIKGLTYFVSGRYLTNNGFQYGARYFMPWVFEGPVTDTKNSYAGPDNAVVPLYRNSSLSSQIKLFYSITPSMNISYGHFYNQNEGFSSAGNAYKYVPDAGHNNYTWIHTHILTLKHVLSPSTFYEFKGAYYQKDYYSYQYQDPHDYRYMPNLNSDLGDRLWGTKVENPNRSENIHPVISDFLYYGNPVDRSSSNVNYYSLIVDLTSQLNKIHLLKIGGLFKQNDIFNRYYSLFFDGTEPQVPKSNSRFYYSYNAKPVEMAAYIQDKIEFKDLIINAGLRFDYFDSDGRLLADPSDPQIYEPFKESNQQLTLQEREAIWWKDAKPKMQISPRFGLSFPISEDGVLHFSYGHFFQNPGFQYLYQNPNFWISGAGASNLVGNADLEAEKTVLYELGLQQKINNFVFHVTGFYRDIRDWITTGDYINTAGTETYYKWENKDQAEAKGITFSSTYSVPSFSMNLNYTFQIVQGTASDPAEAYNRTANGESPKVQRIYLNWDQRHELGLVLTYSTDLFYATLIGEYGSGFPYTPTQFRGEALGSYIGWTANSGRMPSTFNVDLRLAKDIAIDYVNLSFYMTITNLFDLRSARSVYSDTGQPDYSRDSYSREDRTKEISNVDEYYNNPGRYYPPRFIQLGLKVGL